MSCSSIPATLILRTLFPLLSFPKPKKPLFHLHSSKPMADDSTAASAAITTVTAVTSTTASTTTGGLSKTAQKKLLKQQKFEAKRAEKKAAAKAQKKSETERKRKEWEEKLSTLSEEERIKVMESRKELRKERMDKRSVEKQMKAERLTAAKINGQNLVIDLEFSDLMTSSEINSLVQQVLRFYSPFVFLV